MPLAPKTRLGTYEILGPLGAGGMGEVYRARDSRLGREVAIKVLPEAVAASPDRLARFEREARTVAGLNHPNIVTLFSVEDEDGVRFLTMELVEGQSLDRLVTPGGLPIPRVLDISVALAGALVAAHERGVIHRDLKPGNVMVTRDGWVKVLDFGLAKIAAVEGAGEGPGLGATIGATAQAPISSYGQVLGTVPYMAPEQVRGETVDARSDLFAFGAIVYELATGRRPFAGSTSADVTSAILRDVPAQVVSLRVDLPRDLNRIVVRCLEKDPRDRFQTARDVYNELRYVLKEMGLGATTPTPSPGAAPSVAQSAAPTPIWQPTPASAMPASRPLMAVATPPPPTPSPSGSSASGMGFAAPQDAPSIAVLPFVNRSRGEEDEYFSDGLADELLNVLTKIRGLRVAARASSFQFKGKNEDLATIGEKLNVATLLDGSVRKSGNRVRISVQLIKASDRVQLWSETYDRSLDDIFAVQDDIAQSVVKELRATLLRETGSDASGTVKADVAAAAAGHGQSPEAHRLYLQGKYFVDKLSKEDTEKGLQYLNEALALDPSHALAWVELSRAFANCGAYGWKPVVEGYGRAREAALRALQLAPGLADAHVRLSAIQRTHDWDWKGAEESIRKALQLAPGSAEVLRSAGGLAHMLGRFEEAVSLILRSIEQDPLNAGGYTVLAQTYRSMDRLPDAEKAYRKANELSPQRIGVHMVLAIILAEEGRNSDALAAASMEPADWARLTALAYVHSLGGRKRESDIALQQLETKHAVDSAYQIAALHAQRGDLDGAFTWIDRSIAERDAGTAQVVVEPAFRPLHADPRWVDVLKKVGRG